MKLLSFFIILCALALTACEGFEAGCKGCDGDESQDSLGHKIASLTAQDQSGDGGGGGEGGRVSGSLSAKGSADVSVCFELSRSGDLYEDRTSWYNGLEIYFRIENVQPSSLFDSIGNPLSGERIATGQGIQFQKDCPFKSGNLFGFSLFGNRMLPYFYYHLFWDAQAPWRPIYGGESTQAAYLHKFLDTRRLDGYMGVSNYLQDSNKKAPPPVPVKEFTLWWDGGSVVLDIPSNNSVTPTVFLWSGGRRTEGETRNCMEVLYRGTEEEKMRRWHKFENVPLGTFSGSVTPVYPGWCSW
ncbi:MAG: hypothetical protein HYY62_07530 [Deltaproteobacteria bacterium]|nr:hypothetical protein [Deltaproteobacteria bacterium]